MRALRHPFGGLSARLARPLEADPIARYSLALLVAVLAVVLRALPHPLMAEGSPFLAFAGAIILAAIYLGPGPALLCLAISLLALLTLFIPESGWINLESSDVTDLAVFTVMSLALIVVLRAHRGARAESEDAKQRAEQQAALLTHEVAERRRVELALRRAHEELEDFTHAVSHNLREPLRGIGLTAEFLHEDIGDRLGEDARRRLDTLVRLPRQITAQLASLLEYARAGRSEPELVAAPLAQALGDAIEPLRPWLAEQRAEVEVHQPLPTLLCDRSRLVQVLTNLITNGVKYNDAARRRTGPPCTSGTTASASTPGAAPTSLPCSAGCTGRVSMAAAPAPAWRWSNA